MAFTYDLSSATESTAIRSQVRLELGDTVENAGVLPDGRNLQDAELDYWLDRTDDAVLAAVAFACEALARAWAAQANVTHGSSRVEQQAISASWAARARELRASPEVGGGAAVGFGVGLGRDDGYSQAADS